MTGGEGTGAERRNAEAARGIKAFLRAIGPVGTVEAHVIGPVRNAAGVARAVGFAVTGFQIVLENGTVRHTLRHHGDPRTEARRGQLAVTEGDLARLAQIMGEFDAAEAAEPTKQGTPQLRLRKRIGGVDYDVFVEVRRRARQVAFKTMMKRRVE